MKLNGFVLAGAVTLASLGLASAQDARQELTKTYTFNLAPYTGNPYCDTMSFTVTAGLLTGTDTGCPGVNGVLSGAASIITIAPETSASLAYILTDSIFRFGVIPSAFMLIDVKHLTWAIYNDDGSSTYLFSQGKLIPSISPPANALSSAASRLGLPQGTHQETTKSYA